MATLEEQLTEVRENLSDVIPEGGTEADAMFTDDQIAAWVSSTPNLEAASLRGWKVKLGYYADLVDVTDGASSRKLGDLHAHALTMVRLYTDLAAGPTQGRSRVGKIIRT